MISPDDNVDIRAHDNLYVHANLRNNMRRQSAFFVNSLRGGNGADRTPVAPRTKSNSNSQQERHRLALEDEVFRVKPGVDFDGAVG